MFEPGMVVGGRYRLIREIGQGGMATVWEAEHLTLGSPVAVKFLHTSGPQMSKLIDRFMQEARVAASIRHRNVVEIRDFGLVDDSTPYMVMELLEGQSLADRLDQGALAIAEAVYLAALTLRGLAAVHDAGIIHRDLKPENIFLVDDADGTYPKLLDFGVSRRVDTSTNLTQEGMLVGTPDYMSPEQARGLRTIDARTDIYTMGVILYEMLTCRLPFESENIGDLIVMITTQTALPVQAHRPEVPEDLAVIIERAMQKSRDARYHDAREMRHAVMAAGQDLGLGFGDPDSGVSFSSGRSGSKPDLAVNNRAMAATVPDFPAEGPPPPPRAPSTGGLEVAQAEAPAPRRARWPWVLVLAAVAAGLGVASALYMPLPIALPWDVALIEEHGTPWQPISVALPPALLDAGRGPLDAGATVRVAVMGLPPGATLRIDGVRVDGHEARVPAGDWRYSLEVVVGDSVRWRDEHPGDVDGEYQFWPNADLQDAGVADAQAASAEPEPDRRRQKRPRRRSPRRRGGRR